MNEQPSVPSALLGRVVQRFAALHADVLTMIELVHQRADIDSIPAAMKTCNSIASNIVRVTCFVAFVAHGLQIFDHLLPPKVLN